jgi:hypothetical protein
MISPMTPAGTRIVCISDGDSEKSTPGGVRIVRPTVGSVYIVGEIYETKVAHCGFGVLIPQLTEKHGYCLSLFELAALPDSITDCLDAQPIDFDAEIRERDIAVIKHLMPY